MTLNEGAIGRFSVPQITMGRFSLQLAPSGQLRRNGCEMAGNFANAEQQGEKNVKELLKLWLGTEV